MKVLTFDIWGDFAHFRKFYTTTSPLTFSFPPPPTISGILGAIYGTNKNTNEYLRVFGSDKCKITLQILSPIKKVRMGLNLLETRGTNLRLPMSDKNLAPHTQIRTEFLKDPHYRIYVSHEDDTVFYGLCKIIKEHRSVYTASLGLSELLSEFKYVGLFSCEALTGRDTIEFSTPVTMGNLIQDGLEIEIGKRYFKEKMPIKMNQERIIEKYDNVIFEPDGKTIKAKVKNYCKLENGENITFF